ncbi:DUF6759 domain-containing protein [Cloacibacterium sp. TD35]|uniref:DUF6759 domain-containing protein n=1 Tax=Cloacibacterium sp. TD35 TaxID=2976818 RepID=UPI00237E0ECC|nr:DUF6759 domain-containing protein [Cloacibacterium sp. TD35]WDT68906.1 hypothetical protein N7277_04655 [Cloacibacterium sp. TD35]
MKRAFVLFTALCVVHFSAQEKTENVQLTARSQVSTVEAVSMLGNYNTNQESSELKKEVTKPKTDKDENAAFEELMKSENEKNKKLLTAQVLNEMLGSDQKDTLSLLLVKNVSDCNMVLKVVGKTSYNIPIPANGQNAVMVEKGVYQLTGKVCELQYDTQKDLSKNLLVAIKRMEN